MELLTKRIEKEVAQAFAACGYDSAYGKVTVSNRPDLCEYQCNGSLPAAKVYHKAPLVIAGEVVERLAGNPAFSAVEAVKPGFVNLSLSPEYLRDYIAQMRQTDRFGLECEPKPKTIILDYGGANVAKPLHVGHLRSAIIGESLKRINRYFGNRVIGDVHLGDWGLQIGLIIEQLRDQSPELVYFRSGFTGPYPDEAPFTLTELEEIYPAASAKKKEDAAFAARAHETTVAFQKGDPGYRAIWAHIMRLSLPDLKKNYDNLDVHFDLWKGESDAQPDIPAMLADIQARGLVRQSDGALIMDVAEPGDKREVPPCILVKSDGATLYATTDLATMVQRERNYHPDKLFYLTDKRQELYFDQVFRAARKAGIIRPETELQFLGFGTMNGKDGKPFKTRAGGVMRLETLIAEITDCVYQKIEENQKITDPEQMRQTARIIALAALKYGDLSNLVTKDYVFDIDKFSAFEGNTGPYLLYTIVRIKSILARCPEVDAASLPLRAPESPLEKELMLLLSRFADNLILAYRDAAPHLICAYLYDLTGAVNRFYHETKILTEPDSDRRSGYLALIAMSRDVLETCIDLLGFSAPEKM